MKKIVFSILVHEKLEVVIDQVNNFFKFNPESLIILHISKQFRSLLGEDINKLNEIENLIVNPNSIETGLGDGSQLYAHIENIKYIIDRNIDFEYITIHASNDMFIRHGLYDYINNYDAGISNFITKNQKDWPFSKHAMHDSLLKKILVSYSNIKDNIYSSQVEGIFMNKHIADQFINVVNKFQIKQEKNIVNNLLRTLYSNKYIRYFIVWYTYSTLYAKEEIYFSTIINLFTSNIGLPYVYLDWSKNIKIDIGDIKKILNDEKSIYYAVKRVNRDINDSVRQYININC